MNFYPDKKKVLGCKDKYGCLPSSNKVSYDGQHFVEIPSIQSMQSSFGNKSDSNVSRRLDYRYIPPELHQIYFSNASVHVDLDKYEKWENYDYNRHFSTHDWLAYAALMVIRANEGLKVKWNNLARGEFWTKEREKIYLYATAGPDYFDIIHYKNEYPFRKFPDFHLVRFNENGERLTRLKHIHRYKSGSKYRFKLVKLRDYDDIIEVCRLNTRKIIDLLKKKKFNAAAFNLGVLSHYIADCACMAHVYDYMNDNTFITKLGLDINNIQRNDLKKIRKKFEDIHFNYQTIISRRTDGRRGWISKSFLEWDEVYLFDFFKIDINDLSHRVESKAPEKAASDTAIFTLKGGEYDNARFMFNNYLKLMSDDIESLPEGWQEFSPQNKDQKILKIMVEKVQESLKTGILNINNAFNFIIENAKI